MGLLDKAKQQATQLAQKGQEAAQKGQEKLQGVQAKKREDALLRDLGALIFAERTGRAEGDVAAEIDRLVAELRDHEAAHGAVDTSSTADAPRDDAAGASGEGNYSIDDL